MASGKNDGCQGDEGVGSAAEPSALRSLIPNSLTFSRLVVGAAFFWIPESWWLPAVAYGAGTDLIDGHLSRWLGASSLAGQVLDPIADKVFLLGVLVALWTGGRLEVWEGLLVAARDVEVLAGTTWVVATLGWTGVRSMPPTLLGKATTVLQFAFLLALLIVPEAAAWLIVPTGILSLASGADYCRGYYRRAQMMA